jgi:site-specific DNA-methyltransferase (adenine-specific)
VNIKGCFLHNSDEWATPSAFYNELDKEFNFDCDPCPLGACEAFFIPWGKRVYINPPYSDIRRFLEKGLMELRAGRSELLVYLIPARTDTRWFHELILPYHNEIRFIKGRLHFNEKGPAPFPSMIVIFKA